MPDYHLATMGSVLFGLEDIFPTISARKNPQVGFARALIVTALMTTLAVFPAAALEDQTDAARLKLQKQQYDANVAKNIVQLQMFRQSTAVLRASGETLRLINLSPAINSWFLLETGFPGKSRIFRFHLENVDPQRQKISLSAEMPPKLVITTNSGTTLCAPWAGNPSPLVEARTSGLPFHPLCGGRIFLRNRVAGSSTNLERTAQFLRDHIWKGEEIVSIVKDTFFKDSQMEAGKVLKQNGAHEVVPGPGAANLKRTPVIATRTGFDLDGTRKGRMTMGDWYPVTGLPGVFVSALQPWAINPELWKGAGKTNWLDKVERQATSYMVAFDLARFDLGYEVGTDHPRLGWSPRPPRRGVEWNLPGPDGVRSPAPLVNLGMVSPALTARTVATFTGGFKRQHGAFRAGPFAKKNHGSHYGFIVEGVVLSKLQPGLATIFVLNDGSIHMRTWQKDDDALLPQVRFARQNGVPLLEPDPVTGLGIPGPLVRYWLPGNWSGSAEVKLRTLRAGACLKERGSQRFLIYGYFSTATPSAMARTFQAMACKYAMLLDMNAIEHTYLALYLRKDGKVKVEHLVPGMRAIDKRRRDGSRTPRFIGFSDNRDFFYLVRKETLR